MGEVLVQKLACRRRAFRHLLDHHHPPQRSFIQAKFERNLSANEKSRLISHLTSLFATKRKKTPISEFIAVAGCWMLTAYFDTCRSWLHFTLEDTGPLYYWSLGNSSGPRTDTSKNPRIWKIQSQKQNIQKRFPCYIQEVSPVLSLHCTNQYYQNLESSTKLFF
jgi:hypothetical protein